MSNPEERRGRSSLTLDRNCGRYLGGHRPTKVRCSPSFASGPLENVSRYMPMEHQEESGHMYNQAGVDALEAVRAVVASFGAPLLFRKFYGILLILSDFVVHSLRPPMEEAMSRLWSQLGWYSKPLRSWHGERRVGSS